MLQDRLEDIARILNQANECLHDTWKMWKYGDNKLALCGYKRPFRAAGYLVFHGVTYIRLPLSCDQAIFQLVEAATHLESLGLTKEFCGPGQIVVSVSEGARNHFVICSGVRFYALPPERLSLGDRIWDWLFELGRRLNEDAPKN